MIATITEPTENVLNEPITDLDHILAFVNMVGEANMAPIPYDFRATTPNGGGQHTISLDGLSGPVIVQAIAIDLAGNKSSATIVEVDVPINPAPKPPKITVS